MLGGVIVNLVLGFIIYSAVLFTWGEKFLPVKNLTDGIWCVDSIATEIGFRNGDKILSINNKEPQQFEDIYREIIFGGTVKVLRNNQVDSFVVPTDFVGSLVKERNVMLFYPRVPFIFREIPDTSINAASDLRPKDQVLSINGIPVKYYDEYLEVVDTLQPGKVVLGLLRDGKTLQVDAVLSDNRKLEIFSIIPDFNELEKLNLYELETKKYSFLTAIPAGAKLAGERLSFYVRQFKLIFDFKTGAYKGLGGFGTIGGLFPKVWEWQAFWEITAFLSLILAFMNVLPIPALDGGHVAFLLYEMVTRRKPSEKFLEYAQIVGMVIILGLLVFANTNDIVRWVERLLNK
jgi:regulator of sigma E protease